MILQELVDNAFKRWKESRPAVTEQNPLEQVLATLSNLFGITIVAYASSHLQNDLLKDLRELIVNGNLSESYKQHTDIKTRKAQLQFSSPGLLSADDFTDFTEFIKNDSVSCSCGLSQSKMMLYRYFSYNPHRGTILSSSREQ